MNISYDSYRVFYYAAKYRSFSQAAAALYNNQPNVPRMIRRLESELGCALFFRSPQGVRLTPEGEKLYAHIAVACESIEAGEAEILSDQSLQSGIVHIAASSLALRARILQVLARYRRDYAHVRLCRPRPSSHDFYAELFLHHDLAFAPDVEVETTAQVLPVVQSNLGVGFVPHEMLFGSPEESGIYPVTLTEPIAPRELYLYQRKTQPLSVAAKRLRQMLLDNTPQPGEK